MNEDFTLKSVVDPEEQTVSYTYDDAKRVTGVQTVTDEGTHRNVYTYEQDRLKTVSHNTETDDPDVIYTFDYDALGRKTTVKVGEQLLSENVYADDRGGLLKEVHYGNGGMVEYIHDEFDRLRGIRYDHEDTDRYAYEYGANGAVSVLKDNHLNRSVLTEYDLAERPMQNTLRDAEGNLLYRATLTYDGQNRLSAFKERVGDEDPETGDESFETSYSYDRDNRTTQVKYGSDTRKVDYAYDALGRVSSRTTTNGANVYATQYTFVNGGHGENSTTPLVREIAQGAGANAMNFAYEYDSCGNITSETRNGVKTTYEYDKLGQLVRANDPNEGEHGTTWVYEYDLGGNIQNKKRYAYTTGAVGNPLEAIVYSYDSVWKDKLTAYGGKPIDYDAIGNPTYDGARKYEWQSGRQLKKIRMKADPAKAIREGGDAQSGTVLKIAFSNGNVIEGSVTATQATASVFWNGADVTAEYAAAAFNWTRNSGDAAADAIWNQKPEHVGKKTIGLTAADLSGNVKIFCTLAGNGLSYGTVQVDAALVASHTPGVIDAEDTLILKDGMLQVKTARGDVYALEDGHLKGAGAKLNGTVTAEATVFASRPEDAVEFAYNHEGLRIQKKHTSMDGTTTTDYTLHGKLITHQVVKKKLADETETTDEMHFFYDAQSRPAMVEFNGVLYTYVHNLQGDIIGIVDNAGNKVVEYGYDAWGRPLREPRTLTTAYEVLAELNPFRYRGYVWDSEAGLYYLRSRYYQPVWGRFLNKDLQMSRISCLGNNYFSYCDNAPVRFGDSEGRLLEDTIDITYEKHDAIQISIVDNTVNILAYVKIDGDAADLNCGTSGKTYRELTLEGMKEYWSGTYSNVFGENATVSLAVIDVAAVADIGSQRYIPITINNKLGVSNVRQSFSWHYFSHRWGKRNVGRTTMYIGDSRSNYTYSGDDFKFVAAHEFGHNMGVGDAYNKAPNTTSIFNIFGTKVQSIDIEKVLTAFAKNKWQTW